MSTTYEIKLPQFEGPFDLLLFFIERDELDIYDIPISRITDDFLEYLHHLETLNIELASEFILVASTLMRIKAKMLLPRKELDEEGKEIDPREELVQKLLEYRQFKSVIDTLQHMEADRSQKFKRGNVAQNLETIARDISDGEAELHTLTMYRLMHSFHRVLRRFEDGQNKIEHKVHRYSYTIEGEKNRMLNTIRSNGKKETAFTGIFETCENRIHAVFSFLGLLELIQQRMIKIRLGIGRNNFWLSMSTD